MPLESLVYGPCHMKGFYLVLLFFFMFVILLWHYHAVKAMGRCRSEDRLMCIVLLAQGSSWERPRLVRCLV